MGPAAREADVAAAGETYLGIDGGRAWRRLGLAVVAATIASVGMWSVILVLPAAQAEFGIGRGDAALAYTATMLGFAAGNLGLGRLVDPFGIAVVLTGAGLVLAAAFALARGVAGDRRLRAGAGADRDRQAVPEDHQLVEGRRPRRARRDHGRRERRCCE